MANNGVHILKENNPRHHGMREICLGRFLVVLPKIARRVKEFLGDDRRLQPHILSRIEHRLASHSEQRACLIEHVVKPLACSLQARVASLEQVAHVRWHNRITEPGACFHTFYVAQVEHASGIQVHDSTVGSDGADAALANRILEANQSHEESVKLEAEARPTPRLYET